MWLDLIKFYKILDSETVSPKGELYLKVYETKVY